RAVAIADKEFVVGIVEAQSARAGNGVGQQHGDVGARPRPGSGKHRGKPVGDRPRQRIDAERAVAVVIGSDDGQGDAGVDEEVVITVGLSQSQGVNGRVGGYHAIDRNVIV